MTKLSTIIAATVILSGCVSVPNTPTVVFSTQKTPDQYVQCITPKWKDEVESATVSQHRNQYTVVAQSKLAASNVLEVHPKSTGSEVSLYMRSPFTSVLGYSNLESYARACL